MLVEWVGGPDDGEVFEAPDTAWGIYMARLTPITFDEVPPSPTIDTIWVPFCMNPLRKNPIHVHYPEGAS